MFLAALDTVSNLTSCTRARLDNMTSLDALDRALLHLLLTEPKLGVLETSRRLGVARGTAQARIARVEKEGVLRDWAPTVDPGAMGYGVMAFATLEVHQGHELGGGDQPDGRGALPRGAAARSVTYLR